MVGSQIILCTVVVIENYVYVCLLVIQSCSSWFVIFLAGQSGHIPNSLYTSYCDLRIGHYVKLLRLFFTDFYFFIYYNGDQWFWTNFKLREFQFLSFISNMYLFELNLVFTLQWMKESICLESLKIARTLFALMLFHYKRTSLLKYNQNVNDARGARFSYLPEDLHAKEK